MKRILLFAFLLSSITQPIFAQDTKPKLLKEPANWSFEKFNLPPAFAPAIVYKGFEELRFAPGMFKKDSLDYFTYAFAASIDSVKDISPKDIQTYLVNYYKGLCASTAKDRKLTIDTSKISVTVSRPTRSSPGGSIYNALAKVFGVFADGALVKLNMEIKVVTDTPHQRVYLLFIASPQPKGSAVWEKLYHIQAEFKIPTKQ